MTNEMITLTEVWGEDVVGDGVSYWYVGDTLATILESEEAAEGATELARVLGFTKKTLHIDLVDFDEDWDKASDFWGAALKSSLHGLIAQADETGFLKVVEGE